MAYAHRGLCFWAPRLDEESVLKAQFPSGSADISELLLPLTKLLVRVGSDPVLRVVCRTCRRAQEFGENRCPWFLSCREARSVLVPDVILGYRE